MDVNKNIYNTKESIKGLVDVDKNEIKRYNVKPNDLFFTRTSETSDEIGLTSAYTGELMDCVFSGFILRARPIKEDINSRKSPNFKVSQLSLNSGNLNFGSS